MDRKILRDFADTLRQKHGLENLNLYPSNGGSIELASITVPRGMRKQGRGSAALKDITSFADKHNKRVWLQTARHDSESGTTSKGRLEKFYRRHGFVSNRGRHKDFQLSMYASMYRNPIQESVDGMADSLIIQRLHWRGYEHARPSTATLLAEFVNRN